MSEPSATEAVPRLVVVLSGGDSEAPALLALRYAATAAALDADVEVHAVSGAAAARFARGAASETLRARCRQAVEAGAKLYVCPAALAEQGLAAGALIDEISGVRGAASLLGAGLAAQARFMSF